MKIYILTRVSGYALLEYIEIFKTEKEAWKEMKEQYDARLGDGDYGFEEYTPVHAELSDSGNEEFEYYWDITEKEV